MKNLFILTKTHFSRLNTRSFRFLPNLLCAVCFFLAIGAVSLNGQGCCTSTFHVGTGSPSGIATLSAAKIAFPGIDNPGDICILITGQFDVDAGQTWDLGPDNNPFSLVYFANKGSSLFVQNGGTINAASTVFLPCNLGQWLGVYVQSGGTINTNDARFIDAIHAGVSVDANSFFDLYNSKFVTCNVGLKIIGQQSPANHRVDVCEFYNCHTDIYMSNAFNVNILDNTYLNNTPSSLWTGIHMEGFSQNINITGGLFINRYRGISSIKTRNLNVSGARFESCENPVYTMEGIGQLWIKDCVFNETEAVGIHVNYHQTTGVLSPDIHIDHNSFLLQGPGNNIYLKDIGGSGNCLVSNNTIDLPNLGTSPGAQNAYGIEVYKFYATAGLTIQSNQLNHDDSALTGPGGIFVNLITQAATIDANTVSNTGASGPMPSHIRALNCGAALVITGNSTDGGAPISLRGISIEDCPGTLTLCCNNLTNSHTGLYITGPLNNAGIYTTTFGHHPFAALHYNQVSSTGGSAQINHGNNWSGATGQWDAVFDGSSAVAAITNYGVNPLNLPNLLTKVRVNNGANNPGIWFQLNSGVEPTCATAGSCGGNNYPQGGGGRSATADPAAAFSIYPNPANQRVIVDFPASATETTIQLFNLTGQLVIQQVQASGSERSELATEQLPNGFYFLNLEQNGRSVSHSKIMIVHQ